MAASLVAAATHPIASTRRWARRVRAVSEMLRTGAFDVEWYQAQTGQRFRTSVGAALNYLRTPRKAGYSPHPLFEAEYVASGGRRADLPHYLRSARMARLSPHPLFDVTAARRQLRAAGGPRQIARPWVEWIATATAATPVPVPEGMDPISWGELRTLLLAAVREWRAGAPRPAAAAIDWDAAAGRERVGHRASVVLPIGTDLRGVATARRVLADKPRSADWEVLLSAEPTRAQLCCLRAAAHVLPVTVLDGAPKHPATALNAGAVASSGTALVLAYPGARFGADTVDALADALADPAVGVAQPLNEYPDSTIRSAGAAFPAASPLPAALLEGHPAEDGQRLGHARLPATRTAVLAVRADTLVALHGLDESLPDLAEVDLSLRARAAGLGEPWLLPEVQVLSRVPVESSPDALAALAGRVPTPPPGTEELLARAGFRLAGSGLERLPLQVVEGRPGLRWAIDIAAPAGRAGDGWGDRYFAQSLARALGRLGQLVTVDHRDARTRATRRFDDVVLTLRGVDRVEAAGPGLNLLWVISHPSAVEREELAGYARIYAASAMWARDRSQEWGVDVQPLLQCTDPDIFNPGRAEADTGASVLFVGNSRGVRRPAVLGAVAAGAQVDVYGKGWDGLIPASRVIRRVVANERVGELYASAGIVLNDHWEDMRCHGFLSNRVFDAVASGARVVSDDAPGIADVFGDSVQVFTSEVELARLVTEPHERNFADRESRLAAAARIAAEHSFDVRAATLVDAVLELRRAQVDEGVLASDTGPR